MTSERQKGWVHVPSRAELLEREAQYGQSIREWLERNFPDLQDEDGCPHPAAFVAVIRLHYKHGKGCLTVREHGGEIREFVARWERRMEEAA